MYFFDQQILLYSMQVMYYSTGQWPTNVSEMYSSCLDHKAHEKSHKGPSTRQSESNMGLINSLVLPAIYLSLQLVMGRCMISLPSMPNLYRENWRSANVSSYTVHLLTKIIKVVTCSTEGNPPSQVKFLYVKIGNKICNS